MRLKTATFWIRDELRQLHGLDRIFRSDKNADNGVCVCCCVLFTSNRSLFLNGQKQQKDVRSQLYYYDTRANAHSWELFLWRFFRMDWYSFKRKKNNKSKWGRVTKGENVYKQSVTFCGFSVGVQGGAFFFFFFRKVGIYEYIFITTLDDRDCT